MSDDFETFFEPTRIFLFGKKFSSLRYYPESMQDEFSTKYTTSGDKATLPIPPKRIERTLRRDLSFDADGKLEKKQKEVPIFARIYSFSYEAHYYRLPRPLLFLVNDDGDEVGGARGEQPGERDNTGEEDGGLNSSGASKSDARQPQAPEDLATNSDAPQDGSNPTASKALNAKEAARREEERQKRKQEETLKRNRRIARRFSAQFTGVEARDWDFANDIRVWRVDRKDLSVCLDIEVGNYQEILLDSMLASSRQDEDRATRSRGDIIGRGASSFRGDIIGPHQNK